MRKFRVAKVFRRMINCRKIDEYNVYYIQELCKNNFGLGKKKWRNFYAESTYGSESFNDLVSFTDKDEALNYLKKLKGLYAC